jgi:PAS domain S-box-containing protein
MTTYFIAVSCISFCFALTLIAVDSVLKMRALSSRLDDVEKDKTNYESIIEQANDAMLVVDIVDGKVHQCNPSACLLLGYSKTELESKTLFELQPKSMLEKSSGVVADVWEQKGLIFRDIPFVNSSGEEVPVECSARVAPFAGRPAIVIYARDIRERLRMENEITGQQEIIREKNKDITDSINYARRIQTAILPAENELAEHLKDYFVLYKPKDIVSGDFYWFSYVTTTIPDEQIQRKVILIAAVDCTGHGVPGAFMSLVGSTLLNQTISSPSVNHPSDALNYLNRELKKTLRQKGGESSIRDGMDMTFCAIDPAGMKLEFSGANNPIYIFRRDASNPAHCELIELKGDKQPIGSDSDETKKPFSNHVLELKKGDTIYLFTDGYADQFGGPKGKKFKYSQFKDLLLSVQDKAMKEQKIILDNAIEEWKAVPKENGDMHEQVDDILLIGVRV